MDKRGPIGAVIEEGTFVANALRSRGPRHYARLLLVACALVYAPYEFLYLAGQDQLRRVQADLDAARATARYADTYRSLEDASRSLADRLPPADGAEAWLLQTVRETMRQHRLVAQSLSPVTANDEKEFRILALNVTMHARYKDIASWLAELESSRRVLHVATITLAKDTQELGQNTVTISVSTMIPRPAP